MRTLTSATSVPSRARTRARRSTATCRPSSSTPAWDAFRHGYWFALIGFGTGISAEEAALLGAAHELGAWVAKGNEKPNVDYGGWDSNNDLHNNQVGYGIGQDLWRHPQTQPYFSPHTKEDLKREVTNHILNPETCPSAMDGCLIPTS